MLKAISVASVTLITLCAASLSNAATDLEGKWRSIDDKTGFAKALIEIKKNAEGSYDGTVTKIIPRPGYTPKETCQKCPAPYTDKPIVGLTVLSGLKHDPSNEALYSGGKVLDPLSGNVYKSKARISPDGRRLSMRGYVGVSALGRSQTWLRED